MTSKRTHALVLMVVIGAFELVAFQNCSKGMTFSPDTVSTSEALGTISAGCTDSSGVAHDNGTTWQSSTTSVQSVTCVDSADSSQGYDLVVSYLCSNGTVTQTASQTNFISPTAACAAPSLAVSVDSPTSIAGATSDLLVTSNAVHGVSYSCTSVANGGVLQAGALAVGATSTPITSIQEDITCEVTATHGDDQPLVQDVSISLDCESSGKLKDPTTHRCVEFQCASVVALAAGADGTYTVPARTTAGICYSVHLMSAIANSPSSLTTVTDPEIVSRNHDGNAAQVPTHNPYSLGSSNLQFLMKQGGGAREVKLSSSGATAQSIRVDNFLVVGLAKTADTLSANSSYRSYGTTDSSVDGAAEDIMFRNQLLPLQGFGPAGTSTIGSLDITTNVSTEVPYSLDVRARDCGGSRELSDIYLLFQ